MLKKALFVLGLTAVLSSVFAMGVDNPYSLQPPYSENQKNDSIQKGVLEESRKKPAILIDKTYNRLSLFYQEKEILTFPVSLGKNKSRKLRRDYSTTPEGLYSIVQINSDSRFHRFFWINYPNLSDVLDASSMGIIDSSIQTKLERRIKSGILPDQVSPLGGYIGIHGERQRFPTTSGCIVLDNADIDSLFRHISVGTVVGIKSYEPGIFPQFELEGLFPF
jgi:murein L,D-transpeptidase YafK